MISNTPVIKIPLFIAYLKIITLPHNQKKKKNENFLCIMRLKEFESWFVD